MTDSGSTGALATHLAPEGFAAAILGITCTLGILSVITVVLRTFSRVTSSQFGADDGLMILGQALFLADCGVVSYGAFVGLGSRDEVLDTSMKLEGIKYVVFWQIFYFTSLCAIKCAIGITLLRIAVVKTHRVIVYGIIVAACITSLAGLIGVLTTCRPVSANWNPDTGDCVSADVVTNISYAVSISSIITDWACSIVPIFILWRADMGYGTKISVAALLTFGALASVTAIARIPLLNYYAEPDNDYLYHMGIIVVLSVSECGIGLIAGSLPMLRRLASSWCGKDDTDSAHKTPHSLAVPANAASGRSSRNRFRNPTDRGQSRATVKTSIRSGEWEKLDDVYGGGEPPQLGAGFIVESRTVRVEYEMKDLDADSMRHYRF